MSSEQTLVRLREALHVERERRSSPHGHPIWDARCPHHHDRSASVVFGPGFDEETGELNGRTVIHCHAGCSTEQVITAAGLDMADLAGEPRIVKEYPYFDEDGKLKWTVQRWEPKDFRVHPSLPPASERRLYRSEWLRAARNEGRPVFIVEGEKDADTLAEKGHIAVCGVGGAGKWLASYTDQLIGLDVHIIADDDDRGKRHAREVAAHLDGKVKSLHLSLPSYGKDITDQLASGYPLHTVIPMSVTPDMETHRSDQVMERPIAWLWPGYLPQGKLVMIEGDPGDGKSVMTCDLAARLSCGRELPDGSKSPLGPVGVVMISAEDDPEDTIVPRLRVAKGDLRRIWQVTGGTADRPFDLEEDFDALETMIQRHGIKLVIIDPLMAFIPAGVDSYRDADVRRVLHPLSRMAARTGVTILVVRHLTKGRTKAITAGGGSIGFIGASRVGFLIAPHPEDETSRVMSCVKINIGMRPDALAYQIVSDEETPDAPKVVWSGKVEMSAQDLLDGEEAIDDKDVRTDARDFLSDLMDRNPTLGLKWVDVVRAGKKEGHSEHTLRRVRQQVCTSRRNPMKEDGTLMRGTFWFPLRIDDGHASCPSPSYVPNLPNLGDGTAWASGQAEAPPSPTTDHPPEPGPCDVCGSEQSIPFGRPFFTNRCAAHNPMIMEES